jgi:hypothetical protein
MERINDILKPLMGIILLLSFIMVFSSCEKKGGMVENTDTAIIIHKNSSHSAGNDTTKNNSDWKAKVKAEGNEIEKDLENLKVKAKKAGGKIEKDINQAVDKMKADKNKSSNDTSNSRFKENWEEFKTKTKNAIDSLNKKI